MTLHSDDKEVPSSPHQSTSSRLSRHKKSLAQFGLPFALYETFNWIYDKGVFPFTLWFWGPVWGAIIPSALALVINAFVFWLYDYMKVDWLKAHALRELADKENKTNLEKLLTWHLKPRATLWERVMGEVRFALLLIPVDPVIVAVYYRESHFKGVSARDWYMLVKATVVAVIAWLLILEPLVFIVKFLWHTVA